MEKFKEFCLDFLFPFVIGLFLGISITIDIYQYLAVQHNAAHYNPKTAQFEWNDTVRYDNESLTTEKK